MWWLKVDIGWAVVSTQGETTDFNRQQGAEGQTLECPRSQDVEGKYIKTEAKVLDHSKMNKKELTGIQNEKKGQNEC